MKKTKALFIIGGMGPQASHYMYGVLLKLAIQELKAKDGVDFPEIIIHSVPVPDFFSDTSAMEEALEMLKDRVKSANQLNISCISIACNTAHILLKDLQQVSKVPFVSMIEEMVKNLKKDKVKVAGLIGSPFALRSNLYQEALDGEGIKYVLPTDEEIKVIERIIRNIIAGEESADDLSLLIKIADNLRVKGATVIVLGCTELPLVFPKIYSLPVYNSVEVLARSLLRIYYGGNTIQK